MLCVDSVHSTHYCCLCFFSGYLIPHCRQALTHYSICRSIILVYFPYNGSHRSSHHKKIHTRPHTSPRYHTAVYPTAVYPTAAFLASPASSVYHTMAAARGIDDILSVPSTIALWLWQLSAEWSFQLTFDCHTAAVLLHTNRL